MAYAIKTVDNLPKNREVSSCENNMQFLGLLAMIDPPRQEAVQAIADCYAAGITPAMITGDHPITAKAIAYETGILHRDTDRIITGAELANFSEAELDKEIENIKVYARVSPE